MPVHGEVRGDGRIFWGYHHLEIVFIEGDTDE